MKEAGGDSTNFQMIQAKYSQESVKWKDARVSRFTITSSKVISDLQM